jgi:hypothetical protein
MLRVVLLLFVVGSPSIAGIEVSPVVVEAVVVPGSSLDGAFLLRNTGAAPTSVRATVISYADYAAGRTTAAAPGWMRLSPSELVLPAGAESRIAYSMVFAPGTEGESMALVFFMETSRAIARSSLRGRVGAAVYAVASGTTRPALRVDTVRFSPRVESGAVIRKSVIFEVTNPGNVHLRPSGTVRVTSSEGALLADVSIRAGAPVFPGAGEVFSTAPIDLPDSGNVRVRWRLHTEPLDGRPGLGLEGDAVLSTGP